MMMWTIILIFLASAGAVVIALLFSPMARDSLRRTAMWLLLGVGPLLISLLSVFATAERSSGTGTLVSRGWPKPFHFRWASWEGPQVNEGVNALYFLGNSLFYASIGLSIWGVWHLAAARPRNR